MSSGLKAPFPWFGGKSRAATEVSAAMGNVKTYCEPFAGSLGVLLQREPVGHEVANDADGWLVNFWRALRADADGVAKWADYPVTELDLTARHLWLLEQGPRLKATMEADPEAYDIKAAGWWVWGICAWIGSGWCSGEGPWTVSTGEDGPRVVKRDDGRGVNRQLPHLGTGGQGVNRQLPHLGDGRGVNRKLPHLGDDGLRAWLGDLSQRLRRVRVTCGDFGRVLTNSVLHIRENGGGPAGVLLDPPYPAGVQQEGFYAGDKGPAADVWARATAWAEENGHRRELRIVVCGYDGLWAPPPGWTVRQWRNTAGYRREKGQRQEVLWCSPHCLPAAGELL